MATKKWQFLNSCADICNSSYHRGRCPDRCRDWQKQNGAKGVVHVVTEEPLVVSPPDVVTVAPQSGPSTQPWITAVGSVVVPLTLAVVILIYISYLARQGRLKPLIQGFTQRFHRGTTDRHLEEGGHSTTTHGATATPSSGDMQHDEVLVRNQTRQAVGLDARHSSATYISLPQGENQVTSLSNGSPHGKSREKVREKSGRVPSNNIREEGEPNPAPTQARSSDQELDVDVDVITDENPSTSSSSSKTRRSKEKVREKPGSVRLNSVREEQKQMLPALAEDGSSDQEYDVTVDVITGERPGSQVNKTKPRDRAGGSQSAGGSTPYGHDMRRQGDEAESRGKKHARERRGGDGGSFLGQEQSNQLAPVHNQSPTLATDQGNNTNQLSCTISRRKNPESSSKLYPTDFEPSTTTSNQ